MAAGLRGVQSDTDVIGGLLERVAALEGLVASRTAGRVIACTAATRPTSGLYRGLVIFESDTGEILVWYGETTGWQPPWSASWGSVYLGGFFSNGGVGAALTTSVDQTISGLVPGRFLRVDLATDSHFGSTATDVFQLDLTMDSTALGGTPTNVSIDVAGANLPPGLVRRTFTTTLTSHRFRALAQRSAGGGTFTHRGYLSVEDIGPAGSAPAS